MTMKLILVGLSAVFCLVCITNAEDLPAGLCGPSDSKCRILDQSDPTNTPTPASTQMKRMLERVRVYQPAVIDIKKELAKHTFSHWSEDYEYMETEFIPTNKITQFLDYFQSAYDGISKGMRKKMEGILWGRNWRNTIFEFEFKAGAMSENRYGMIVLARSLDRKHIHCAYVMFKMDYRIAQVPVFKTRLMSSQVVSRRSGWWWSSGSSTTSTRYFIVNDKVWVDVTLPNDSIQKIKAYFRYKALDAFMSEGLLDRITYVQDQNQATK